MIMLIGLVMFILVGIVLYISKGSVKKASQQNAKKTQSAVSENQPIKEFVAGCVDKLAKDALVMIGQQGGYIYTNQGGTLINLKDSDEGLFFIKNQNIKIAYNIKNPSLKTPLPYFRSLPEYPLKNFPYKNLPCAKSNPNMEFRGIFGVSTMPYLNPSGGPHSMQTQIETFIDSNLGSCLDFSAFKARGYEIEILKSKTKVTIGSSDISVASEIPIKAKNTATNEILDLKDFSATLNVRLKDLYYFVKELVENDVQDITFDMEDSKNSKDSFYVKVAENAYKNDDLVIVRDEKSLVYGQPLEYAFARQNRFPALYCIDNSNLEFTEDHLITKEDLLGDSELKAEDPDEDAITFDAQALLPNPSLPAKLTQPYTQFKVSASDGEYTDYQIITVKKI